MTSLKKLLAFNMKEQRRVLGISQAVLAERVNTSTHYIAMIELMRKTPSLPMLERIAVALEIDPPELFSMRKFPFLSITKLKKAIIEDIEKAVDKVISEHLDLVDKNNEFLETEVVP
jgi:transcriptional regulator with XRE-family HTH domain